jgi:hypothetical protein
VFILAVVLQRDASYPHSGGTFAESLISASGDIAIGLSFALVGGFVAMRRPRNVIGWTLLLAGVVMLVGLLLHAYADIALLAKPGEGLPAGMAAFAIADGSWTALMAGVFTLLVRFPSGEVPSSRWRIVSWAVLAAFGLVWIGIAVSPSSSFIAPYDAFESPLALYDDPGAITLVYILVVPCLIMVALAAFQLVLRFRRSRGAEREQYKWLAFSAAVLVVTLPLSASAGFGILPAAEHLFVLALIALPVSVGIAVLRYRLYEIDRIINRTLVYAPLTAILAGLFVAVTGLLRAIFTSVTDMGSDGAVAFSTLAVVAALTPVKNRLQALVDARFKDPQDTLKALKQLQDEGRLVARVLDRDSYIVSLLGEIATAFELEAASVELVDSPDQAGWAVGHVNGAQALALPLVWRAQRLGVLSVCPRTAERTADNTLLEALAEPVETLAHVIAAVPPRPSDEDTAAYPLARRGLPRADAP